VRAVHFAAPIPTYLATLAAGRVSPQLYVGPHACTRYGDVAAPALPGDRWVRVRTRLGGICGSDLNVITLKASPSASPFSSFPFVLGHENVGTVVEVGRGVRGVAVGERVTANPLLCCEPRGLAPCARARRRPPALRALHRRRRAPGHAHRHHARLGGSWGEEFVAHESQVLRVPDALTDDEAVLVEPLACSVHAVRANLPAPASGCSSSAPARSGSSRWRRSRRSPRARVTVLAAHDFQAEHAERLGAARVVRARGDALAPSPTPAGCGSTSRSSAGTWGWAASTARSSASAHARHGRRHARHARRRHDRPARQREHDDGLDWTPLWLKELTVRGSLCYGAHAHGGTTRGAVRRGGGAHRRRAGARRPAAHAHRSRSPTTGARWRRRWTRAASGA
jgi:threonine dehydrogenase-like Zn-dependent dehydrogenase